MFLPDALNSPFLLKVKALKHTPDICALFPLPASVPKIPYKSPGDPFSPSADLWIWAQTHLIKSADFGSAEILVKGQKRHKKRPRLGV